MNPMERRPLVIPPKSVEEPPPAPRKRPPPVWAASTVMPNGTPADDDDDDPEYLMEGYGFSGRPFKYRKSWDKIARNMRMLGYNKTEIAEAIGVKPDTIDLWIRTYESFAQAWEAGGPIADARVTRAMYKRAVGYSHPDVKIFHGLDGTTVVPFTKHYPPETPAIQYWLGNRQPKLWKSLSSVALTGADGKDLPAVPPSISVMVIQSPHRQRPMIEGKAAEAESPGV